MKKGISKGIAAMAVAVFAMSAGATETAAQTLQAANLQLKKTYAAARMGPLSISSLDFGGTPLFSPNGTLVNCPKTGGNCLLRVDVTLQASVGVGESLNLYARADYADSADQLARVISSVTQNGFSETRSYTWFLEVTPGDHIVDSYAWTENGLFAWMERGSLTISVFK
jgi:hypothetical protein